MGVRKSGQCKWFNGIQNKVCKAGVSYDSLPRNERGVIVLPCIQPECQSNCDKYEEPTAEEIAADEEWMRQRMEMHRKVGEVIIPIRKEYKGRSGNGTITCPCCGGNLHWSISGYNGHMHGRCETAGCVSWME
jgi:hypothetical protein